MTDINSNSNDRISLRHPELGDAATLWQLVSDSGILDLNSSYLYLLLCRDFARTCLVAQRDGQVIGFVTAYRPPQRPNVLFIWQVCVCQSARRQGLALRMLCELVDRTCAQSPLQFVEATVAPSNRASLRMFESLARKLGLRMTQETEFSPSDFPAGDHQAEPLIRIGRFPNGKSAPSPSVGRQATIKSPVPTASKEETLP